MFADGVMETSSTVGTDDYVLTGSAFQGQTFAVFPDEAEVSFIAQTLNREKFEIIKGSYDSGPPRKLRRTTVLQSSAGGAKIDWQADDEYYIASYPSATAIAGLITGNMDTVQPWWLGIGGRWWDKSAGVAVSWLEKLKSSAGDVRIGFYDAVKQLYFPDNRRRSVAVGAANRTFVAADIGGYFTFDTAVADRTVNLPLGDDVGDGYHFTVKGLSAAHGVILNPNAADGIDGGAVGITHEVQGALEFTVRWSEADDMWVTDDAGGFRTGNIKLSILGVEPGWLLMDDKTIGSSGSTADYKGERYRALYNALYTLDNAWAPVSGGRGASASADWTANKPIAVTKALGRLLGVAGSGSGLTPRVVGQTLGAESHGHSLSTGGPTNVVGRGDQGGGLNVASQFHGHSGSTDTQPNFPPTLFLNALIKI